MKNSVVGADSVVNSLMRQIAGKLSDLTFRITARSVIPCSFLWQMCSSVQNGHRLLVAFLIM